MKRFVKIGLVLLVVGTLIFHQARIEGGNSVIASIKQSTGEAVETLFNMVEEIQVKVAKIEQQIGVLLGAIEQKPDIEKLKLVTAQIKCGRGGGAGIIIEVTEDFVYVLTAHHITRKNKQIDMVLRDKDGKFIMIRNIPRENLYEHKKVDLSLLKVPRPEGEFVSVRLAPKRPNVAETIYTIGHPVNVHFSVNKGIVVNYFKRLYNNTKEEYMLVSAPSFSGNSGGAVINNKTELIGIAVGIMYLGESPRPPTSRTIYLFHMTYVTQLKFIEELMYEAGVLYRICE